MKDSDDAINFYVLSINYEEIIKSAQVYDYLRQRIKEGQQTLIDLLKEKSNLSLENLIVYSELID